jgi:hypothetical protein
MTRNALVLVLSIFAAVGANSANAQSTQSSLCQVELRPTVLAIRTAIESMIIIQCNAQSITVYTMLEWISTMAALEELR